MAHPYYPAGTPRFNHVAMSVPADLLGEKGRQEICRFFDEVLGFTEMADMTIDRQRLILSCVHWDQFIFLIADENPMTCPRLDHFGLSVGSLDDLMAVAERAKAYRERDDRVDLIDHRCDDQGTIRIHSIYVKFLLPMMCEIQWWEFVDERVAEMNRRANQAKQA
jgi:hypothetical protein